MVRHVAGGVLDVTAELHGYLIVRMAAIPDRDSEADGLEVEECHGRRDAGEGIGQARVDDDLPRLNGSALSIRRSAQEHVLGQVEDGPVALLVQLERSVRHGVERADVMRRQLGPAARGKGAGIRRRAMRARGHSGERPREHAGQRVDRAGSTAEQRLDHLRHVGADEQVAQVRVRAGPVEVHDLQPADVEPAPLRHVGLNGDVEQVRLPHAGRGLDLGQAEAMPLALEDVHRHEDTVRAEGRLVHGGAPCASASRVAASRSS
jgi:hypothetical protein